jgi:hypothetical protein
MTSTDKWSSGQVASKEFEKENNKANYSNTETPEVEIPEVQ